jgi:hypothetical protein
MSRFALSCFALLCLVPGLVLGAAPKAVISGPERITVGSTLFIEASDSEGDDFQILQTYGAPLGGRWFKSEQVYVVGTPIPGEFGFVLVAAGVIDGKAKVDLATYRVLVEGAGPSPGPNPGPNPGPSPVPPGPAPPPAPLPPGKYNLAQLARDWAVQTVPEPPRTQSALMLAGSMEAMTSKFAANMSTTTFRDMWPQVRASNQAALGPNAAYWAGWDVQWRAYVGQLQTSGKLTTVQDGIAALNEAAAGLKSLQSGRFR